jgi:uncharacterized protein (UPF0276 family)
MSIAATLPPRSGIGLKPEHWRGILADRPDFGFIEIHAENYMGAGGPPHRSLAAIREQYPLSVHGVGLSIGGGGALDRDHLARLRTLLDRYEPESFSEHLAWSTHDGAYLNDLLPLPYTDATLANVVGHIDEVQDALGRRMLLENPSSYLAFEESEWPEIDFLAEIAARTGCGLLLDVNNVMVSAVNLGFDPRAYLDRFPVDRVGEIHLAGYDETVDAEGDRLLIDAHGSRVRRDVWDLYLHTLGRTGPVATLVEWDNDVPPLAELLDEAAAVDRCLHDAAVRAIA